LLYPKYNKNLYEQYTSKIENLIVLENFLFKSNFYLDIAATKSRTGKEEKKDDFNKLMLIENLKK